MFKSMKAYAFVVLLLLSSVQLTEAQCSKGEAVTFARWSGVTAERVAPVFVYTASGEEESLAGACLARCRELTDCAAVIVTYSKGNCLGIARTPEQLKVDNDATYFKKICLELPNECSVRWWAIESTPGYHLLTDRPLKVMSNKTMNECYASISSSRGERTYRSAQWVGPTGTFDPEMIQASESSVGSCVVNAEDKFTEPESYRVSNYFTFYIENQCRHDYLEKIDRCSYEEYYNQTLKHVEYTVKNYTKDECKKACEVEARFVCRGFTWISGGETKGGSRGICDLHSEDLVTTGSWLLRRTSAATYYRRVICLNISVDCEASNVVVTYRPRGIFRGRIYVPGRGEKCSASSSGSLVKLTLPMHGDCDVNFAYGISNGPNGVINRTMAYVMVMIQNNPIIQTAGDRWVRVGCSPDARVPTHVDATLAVRDNARATMPSETGRAMPAAASAVYGPSSAPLTMYVVRVDEDSSSASSSVSLGELLELRVETTDSTEIEAYHLVASSRLGDSSVLLIDGKGCPTGQVDFPAFTRSWLGGTQRLSARFKAFRFPTSHVVRFSLIARYCEKKCEKVKCGSKNQGRIARQTNGTVYYIDDSVPAPDSVGWEDEARSSSVVALGGIRDCGGDDSKGVPLELVMTVDSKDILSADTLIRADHRSNLPEDMKSEGGTMVCIHELLLVALVLAWLAVQVLLLLGCCVLVKRYRNLAELSMQKDYHSFDNVGFDTVSTHRRVHWPDQHVDILHAT